MQVVQTIPDDAYKKVYSDEFIAVSVNGMTSPWMQYFIKYDLAKEKKPLLFYEQ
jgi:hypothetical protein